VSSSFFHLFSSLYLTFNTLKVKARGSQARGEAKTKTASLVEALYGFDSGRSKKAIAENRKKVEELKSDKGFVFEVSFIIIIYFSFNLINLSGTFGFGGQTKRDL
jgi:hypothetical protein